MIREINIDELDKVNKLLEEFNYKLSKDSFNNDFLRVLVYCDYDIVGVLVYDLIYDRAEIDYIIVDENYRNKGIATSLLKYLEKNNNLKNITLEVRNSNIKAINFYLKNGFLKSTIRKNYYNNEDGILMIKNLGD